MMLARTERTALEFIADRLWCSGVGPSYTEIAGAMGIKSKSGVHRAVNGLEAKGFITKHNRARSICLTDRARTFLRNDAHPAACPCAPCAAKKFAYGLRLVDALDVQAARKLHGVALGGIKFRHSDSHAAAHAAGVSPAGDVPGMSRAGRGSHSKVRP